MIVDRQLDRLSLTLEKCVAGNVTLDAKAGDASPVDEASVLAADWSGALVLV